MKNTNIKTVEIDGGYKRLIVGFFNAQGHSNVQDFPITFFGLGRVSLSNYNHSSGYTEQVSLSMSGNTLSIALPYASTYQQQYGSFVKIYAR